MKARCDYCREPLRAGRIVSGPASLQFARVGRLYRELGGR